MRVVCVNQDPGIGPDRAKGAAVHLQAIRHAMMALGADVEALDESAPDEALRRLERLQADGAIDLLYERYALGRPAAAEFAGEHGIPYVLEVNAPLALETQRWRGGRDTGADRDRDRVVFTAAQAVIAVSTQVADYAISRGADRDAMRVFPNGVDGTLFRPRLAADPIRRKLVPEGRFALGFHGRLRPWHGFERLADACARLLERGADIHLVTVGRGDFAASLDGRVEPSRRTLIGWRPHAEMGRYVAAFDAMVLSYGPHEDCYFSPLKLAEALACGVVPIVPDLGDLSQAVRGAGIVYPAGDVDAIVDAVEWLIDNPRIRAHLARRGVRHARGMSWERIAAFALGVSASCRPPAGVRSAERRSSPRRVLPIAAARFDRASTS